MGLKSEYIEFHHEIKQREIECLIHFTTTINLFSILENSEIMISRAKLENLDIEPPISVLTVPL